MARPFHGISGFVLRRVGYGVVTLLLISVLVFGATQALPGDPARAVLGQQATPEKVEQLNRQLGLDRPAISQYTDWLGGLVTGDLGRSLASERPVSDVLSDRIVNSAFLMLIAGLIAIPLSILVGAYAALRRDRAFDTISSGLMLTVAALPEFVVGVLLIVAFATTLFEWLPGTSLIPPGDAPWLHMTALILPAATLILPIVPYVGRVMRGSMVEVLESEYVQMARLKGLSERVVIRRHALPNALPATFQVIALNLAFLAGGIVVVEFVFGYPGIGSGLTDAVRNRDIPVIQTLAMLIAAVYVVTNMLADIATILVSPRLRTTLP